MHSKFFLGKLNGTNTPARCSQKEFRNRLRRLETLAVGQRNVMGRVFTLIRAGWEHLPRMDATRHRKLIDHTLWNLPVDGVQAEETAEV